MSIGNWSIYHTGIFGCLFLDFGGDKNSQSVEIIILITVGIKGSNTELDGENDTTVFIWVNSYS